MLIGLYIYLVLTRVGERRRLGETMKYYCILLIILGVACSKQKEQVKLDPTIVTIKGAASVKKISDGTTRKELKLTAKNRAKLNYREYFTHNCIKPIKMPPGVFNFFSNGTIEFQIELQRSLLVTQKCTQGSITAI